jgi:hypothetical protein
MRNNFNRNGRWIYYVEGEIEMKELPPIATHVPKECTDSDGDRIIKDVNGNWINLARCPIKRDVGLTDYCDEIRAYGTCPRRL